MWQLVKWEWRYCRKSACLQLFGQIICIFIVLLLYSFWKEEMFQVSANVFALPEEIYAFMGLKSGIVTGNSLFYIQYVVMYLNVWMAWNACSRALYLLQASEQTGSICSMCNQWYSKKRIGWGKLLCALIVFWGQSTLWYGTVLAAAVVGSFNAEQRVSAVSAILLLWLRMLLVISILIILTFCVGVYCRYPMVKGMWCVNGFFVISLFAGNFYKVGNLFRWLEAYIQTGSSVSLGPQSEVWFGYWLSPLSWLNPFVDVTENMLFVQFCLCAILAILGIWLGRFGYGKRRIYAL